MHTLGIFLINVLINAIFWHVWCTLGWVLAHDCLHMVELHICITFELFVWIWCGFHHVYPKEHIILVAVYKCWPQCLMHIRWESCWSIVLTPRTLMMHTWQIWSVMFCNCRIKKTPGKHWHQSLTPGRRLYAIWRTQFTGACTQSEIEVLSSVCKSNVQVCVCSSKVFFSCGTSEHVTLTVPDCPSSCLTKTFSPSLWWGRLLAQRKRLLVPKKYLRLGFSQAKVSWDELDCWHWAEGGGGGRSGKSGRRPDTFLCITFEILCVWFWMWFGCFLYIKKLKYLSCGVRHIILALKMPLKFSFQALIIKLGQPHPSPATILIATD